MDSINWYFVVIVILIAWNIVYAFTRRASRTRDLPSTRAEPSLEPVSSADLYAALQGVDPLLYQAAHPESLLNAPEFETVVGMLCRAETDTAQLLRYLGGDNLSLACAAGEALRRRDKDPDLTEEVLQRIGRRAPWVDWFALRYLSARASRPVAGEVFIRSENLWREYGAMRDYFNAFLEERRASEGAPSFGRLLDGLSEERVSALESYLQSLAPELVDELLMEIEDWRAESVDTSYLQSVGRVWPGDSMPTDVVMHPTLESNLRTLGASLDQSPPRSILVVGEPGVGKTVLCNELCRRMQDRGWRIFEATAANVIAGQVYIGEIEQRIEKLCDNLGVARKVLWYVPNFHELYFSGRHRYSEMGMLDLLMPYIESGAVTIVGETTLDAHERLLQVRPQLRIAVDAVRLPAADDGESLQIALDWSAMQVLSDGRPYLSPELVRECHRLARYHLGERSAPGNTFRLIRTALEHHKACDASTPVKMDDVLQALSRLTGLPIGVLDDRKRLDLNSIRERFVKRVLGQAEAVECLVERIAMLKAGLTDPDRPLGVFLFAGPTGTGKTEIAKSLAEFLFGSDQRMIRLDMSEYSSDDSARRLVSSSAETPDSRSLLSTVRQEPFSVVLLDEFEKAHPTVWDLFLQVFDDGRLTDASGNTADFRHAIIILTSNLGATVGTGSSIGFTLDKASFSLSAVRKAVDQTFRREFVNRLDRIVVFRPLDRSLMREILHKELNDALGRRGLRNREWAVEWEESAIEFLLDKGFTADLGARPLKRAIEQHVLAPLAMTIVEHQFPEGDQFLFLRSDGDGVQAEFVDPDGPEQVAGQDTLSAAALDAEVGEHTETSLRSIALVARGNAEELHLVRDGYQALDARIRADDWRERKQDALAKTNSLTFWDSPERYRVLGDIEFMDRVESGMQTAGSLLRRIDGNPRRRSYSAQLMRRLAQQIYLVGMACDAFDRNEPRDAFLCVEAGKAGRVEEQEAQRLYKAIVDMYGQWARKRRMRHERLDGPARDSSHALLAVSGFGAYAILAEEAGLHVWEIPSADRDFDRYQVRVRVAPQLDEPSSSHLSPREQAERV
ncbi:MAG: AAA domain-containing protein, partial [Gammaproteobacteria bacterium]|nr:AAA domain-containing protein [Gammaproteobacteria bacterium]NIM74693.1 AAA domain-containing protein [Gammaproteobacteria bacterium]NIN37510.1 AAA domain-containing protein [Gammaproteobacteria bacterium]NIO26526.1 AAA domain-containing protein [Gammaproteobacteria bacterium]NIO67078.1 AAA domain-containing protein [Gammaproteobacteria bacterium]